MPFLDYENFDACVTDMENEGYDEESARAICGALQEEHEERGKDNAESLKDKILNGASALIDKLDLGLFSFVDTPAQPSKFVLMKSENAKFDWKSTTNIVRKKDQEDWSKVFGAVMVPNIVDKQGDIITLDAIEKAADEFIMDGNINNIDADHDMISGKGKLAQSWTLKQDQKWECPDGSSVEYPKGTWMVGVYPTDEIKERIEQGDITGFSIYGESHKYRLKSTEKYINNKNNIGDDIMEDEFKEILESTLKEHLDFQETFSEIKDTLDSINDKLEKEEVEEEPEPEEEVDDEFEEEKEELSLDDLINELATMIDMSVEDVKSSLGIGKEEDEDEDDDEEEEDKSEDVEEEESEEDESKKVSKADFTPLEELDSNEPRERKSMREIAEEFR